MTTYSPPQVGIKPFPYQDFQGIDTSRDPGALDTGDKQHMVTVNDGYADWRGTLVRDPGATQRTEGNRLITHLTFFGRNLLAWAQKDGGGTSLVSERDHIAQEVYPQNAVVCSAIFNSRAQFFCRDNPIYSYDGFKFAENKAGSKPRPAYGVAIQRRLAIAGAPDKRTRVDLSRVDQDDVFPDDEDENSALATKAADIDIANIIGTADEIRGLGVFETNRLAVFTNDQTLLYQLHPDFTKWQLEDRVNIRVGTVSHNSVVQAGADLFFAARDGVHSLRRSDTNGITVFSVPMSKKIDTLYRQMLRQVGDNAEQISGFWDQTAGQYHLFFPISDLLAQRITMTLDPTRDGGAKWSTGTFLNARCGRQLGGVTAIGTPGGIWERGEPEDVLDVSPEMVILTPILWQGSINDTKQSHSFILQASGKGRLVVEALDETGRPLSSLEFQIENEADNDFAEVPLAFQYERKFEHRYRGVQFRFTTSGRGLLKIIGFAVTVRT